MDLTQALPTTDSVLQLEPAELAPYLLEHLASNANHLSLRSLLSTSIGSKLMQHYKKDERVERALREAWAWLEGEGLLIAKEYGHFISSRGQRIRGRQDFDAYRRSAVLPKASLHPVIAERVWSSFVRGEYDTAVFQAFKEVEIAVRSAGGFATDDLGTALMGEAFKVGVGPLTDKTAPIPEQLAMVNVFSGAIGLFKNPSSHRHVSFDNPSIAAELISFASLLMRIVDGQAVAPTEKSN